MQLPPTISISQLHIDHDVFTELSRIRRQALSLMERVPPNSITVLHIAAIEEEALRAMREIAKLDAALCSACDGTGHIEPEYLHFGDTERQVSPGYVCPVCEGAGTDERR